MRRRKLDEYEMNTVRKRFQRGWKRKRKDVLIEPIVPPKAVWSLRTRSRFVVVNLFTPSTISFYGPGGRLRLGGIRGFGADGCRACEVVWILEEKRWERTCLVVGIIENILVRTITN